MRVDYQHHDIKRIRPQSVQPLLRAKQQSLFCSPKLGFNHHFYKSFLIYGSTALAHKPGSFASSAVDFTAFDDEKI